MFSVAATHLIYTFVIAAVYIFINSNETNYHKLLKANLILKRVIVYTPSW